MKYLATLIVACGLSAACQSSSYAPHAEGAQTVVLGTYDSRAVAIAYVASDTFKESLSRVQEELQQAKEAGDTERASELEASGAALQNKLHTQAFGDAPIREMMATIEGQLPELAKQANVDVIVSKWSVNYNARPKSTVDVTELVLSVFHPSEQTLEHALAIMDMEPVPLEELHNH